MKHFEIIDYGRQERFNQPRNFPLYLFGKPISAFSDHLVSKQQHLRFHSLNQFRMLFCDIDPLFPILFYIV